MKIIVVTIDDAVCAKNGRDPEATILIEKARLYGTVESGDSFIAAERAKYQSSLNSLTAQLEAINENKITPAELEVLRVLRQKSAKEGKVYEDEIAALRSQLQKVVEEGENRSRQIKAILGS